MSEAFGLSGLSDNPCSASGSSAVSRGLPDALAPRVAAIGIHDGRECLSTGAFAAHRARLTRDNDRPRPLPADFRPPAIRFQLQSIRRRSASSIRGEGGWLFPCGLTGVEGGGDEIRAPRPRGLAA
jgi:hypothetical protein